MVFNWKHSTLSANLGRQWREKKGQKKKSPPGSTSPSDCCRVLLPVATFNISAAAKQNSPERSQGISTSTFSAFLLFSSCQVGVFRNQQYLTNWNRCFYSNTILAWLILGKVWNIPWRLVGCHELMVQRSYRQLFTQMRSHVHTHTHTHACGHTHTCTRERIGLEMCAQLWMWY